MRLTKERRTHRFALSAILTICLFGCGYHFAGRGGSLPSDIKTVAIPFFTNKTFESRIESLFTDALIDEFLKRGRLKVGKREESDATIIGTIKSFTTSSISLGENDNILEYRATVMLDVSLKRNDDGTTIWGSSDLSWHQEYAVSPNIAATNTNEREAIKKIAEDLAEYIHHMIFEDF